jgi:hypothetical protein
MDDRRLHDRYRLWIPARIEGEGEPTRLAVGHDMSQKGSLMVTNVELEVGRHIVLFVCIPPDTKTERKIEAHVLRCERNTADPNGLWPYQIAVEFTEADPGLEKLLRAHPDVVEGIADSREPD